MQIQGRLHFSRDDVTCVPVDPALSAYTDRLAFDEEALAFRIRLFGARVSKGGPAACVALVLPRDLVLCSADTPGGVPESQTEDFDGAGAFDLHVVTTGPVDRPYRIAVERLVIDEVIAFARSFGLYPVEVVIPTPDSEDTVTLPIENDQPLPDGVAAVRAPGHRDGVIAEMPEALRRELLKRQMQQDRQSPRARRSWSISTLIPGRAVLGQAMAPAAATRLVSAVSEILVPLVDTRSAPAPETEAVGAAPARAIMPEGNDDAPLASRNPQPSEPAPVTVQMDTAVAKAPPAPTAEQIADRTSVEISPTPTTVPIVVPTPIATPIAPAAVTGTPAGLALRATIHRARIRVVALSGRLSARMRATGRRVTAVPAEMGRSLRRFARPMLARFSHLDWHRFARPAPLAVAGIFGILAVVGHVLTDRLGPQSAAPVILTSNSPDVPSIAPIPQLAPLAVATETLNASARPAAISPGRVTASDPADSPVAPTASPAETPILVTQSASAAHGRRSVTPEPLSITPRHPVRPDATLAAAPTAWMDPAPMRSAAAFPAMPETEMLTGMALTAAAPPPAPTPRALPQAAETALPAAEPSLSEPPPAPILLTEPASGPVLPDPEPAPVQTANTATSLVLTASAAPAPAITLAPRIADRVAPRPRPVTPPLAARAENPAPPPQDLATPAPVVSAAPPDVVAAAQPTQRPVARPATLQAGNTIPSPVPAVTLASAPAPAAEPPTARLEVIAPNGPSSLEVLAIVGTGTARQALVRTGPSQTAVLVPGARLASWQVVEVRRNGVVLTRAGNEGFLPFDR
ncbi:hypothetical protein [Roseicyclus marinus]|uniref:hypothetical protein n=1 Tax=Roseicyclus marinus TaxID=2161673 RepID=UPI00240FCCEE|nr:hypothetical protein [Roseicyclus marinus]MDG3040183.1 hypothetical protein [Roseicyclus marinus]